MACQPGINVLSLFDGISCGRVALARAGIPVARCCASEVDKHAIAVSRANWPDAVHLGDVCGVQPERFAKCPIDLLFAGSPCQGFSNNGTGDGFEHKQSKLFWEFIRLLRALKPKHFLLENVKMKKEWRDIISREVGCEPLAINSSLLSAQSRPRLHWTNLPSAGMPKDLGLTIFDILEMPTAPSQPMITKAQKAYCLTATHGNCLGKDGKPIPSEIAHNTKRHQRTCILGRVGKLNYGQADRVCSENSVSPTLLTTRPPKVGVRPRVLGREATGQLVPTSLQAARDGGGVVAHAHPRRVRAPTDPPRRLHLVTLATLRQAALPRTRQWLDGRRHRPPTVDTPAGGEAEAAQDHLHPLHRVNTKPQKQNHTPPLPPKTYVFSSLGLGQ